MNIRSRTCWFIPMLAASFLAGCATTSSPMSRIDANRPLYQSWPLEVQQAVLDGRVEEGMTPDMVRMALGEPTEVTTRGISEDLWIYRKGGSSPLGNIPIAVMGGVAGINVATTTGGSSSAYQEQTEVVFRNGQVVSVNQAP